MISILISPHYLKLTVAERLLVLRQSPQVLALAKERGFLHTRLTNMEVELTIRCLTYPLGYELPGQGYCRTEFALVLADRALPAEFADAERAFTLNLPIFVPFYDCGGLRRRGL